MTTQLQQLLANQRATVAGQAVDDTARIAWYEARDHQSPAQH